MDFNLEKFFADVFAPHDDVVTIMHDFPVTGEQDTDEWRDRRNMAEEWHREITKFSSRYHSRVNPLVRYEATGAHNSDLPENAVCEGKKIEMEDAILYSTIIISMPEFSASAPLLLYTQKHAQLRVASMPGVKKTMEKTGLSADYGEIAKVCSRLAELYEAAVGIDVLFSTGHRCYFDISDHKEPFQDNGILHKSLGKDSIRLKNLPSGEVCVTPNEATNSLTQGHLPFILNDETIVLVVKENKIVDVEGSSPNASRQRGFFLDEPARCNIAEVAVGCNDKAAVTGHVLEDEKAGFHWAYGRSDHLGGKIGIDAFSAPDKVIHQDIVYAKGNPIVCSKLEFLLVDGRRKTAIRDGDLILK